MSTRKIVSIANDYRDICYHCGNCCTTLDEWCDCELEKIPLYAEYIRKNGKYAKKYAYECLTCGAINKVNRR